MKITTYKSQIKTIKSNDRRFLINDGLMVSPRAGVEISKSCPYEYRLIINECLKNGWLQPVAHVTEKELLFIGLSNE